VSSYAGAPFHDMDTRIDALTAAIVAYVQLATCRVDRLIYWHSRVRMASRVCLGSRTLGALRR
jgi:hypothetical protein